MNTNLQKKIDSVSVNDVELTCGNTSALFTSKNSVKPNNRGLPELLRGVINLDYLQVSCSGSLPLESDFNLGSFSFVSIGKSSNHYNSIFIVYDSVLNCRFAQVQAHPKMKIAKPDTVLVKFQNQILYHTNLDSLIERFFRVTRLSFKNLSRFDIALDFNFFYNKLLPHNFISRFYKQVYIKRGRGKFTSVCSSSPAGLNYEYFRVNSRASDYCIYLYNKSLELKQVQDKKYIKETWSSVGLDLNLDVWRLEVSVKGANKVILNHNTGLMESIMLSSLFSSDSIKMIFMSIVNKGFVFVRNDGTVNKSRMKPLKLFEPDHYEHIRLIRDIKSINKLKTKKQVLKQLYMERHKPIDIATDYNLQDVVLYDSVLNDYCKKYNLYHYLSELESSISSESIEKLQFKGMF